MADNQHVNPPLSEWLRREFQTQLEDAVKNELVESDPAEPYKFKYLARETYKQLISQLTAIKVTDQQESEMLQIMSFLVQLFLATNYFDTEEYTLSSKEMHKAKSLLEPIENCERIKSWSQYLLSFYTNYGFLLSKNDDFEGGKLWLEKALPLYKECVNAYQKQGNTVQHFPAELNFYGKLASLSAEEKTRVLRPLVEGGVSIDYLETMYTQTVFFLAQVHSKLGNIEQAAEFSFATMKRQAKFFLDGTKELDFADFTNNVLGLAAYYMGAKRYAQADLIIREGAKLIPKRMKAEQGAFLNLLGQVYSAVFELNIQQIKAGSIDTKTVETLNKMTDSLLNDPHVAPVTFHLTLDYETAKNYFKTALNHFKEAMVFLPLDGNVGDYTELIKEISKLYHRTLQMETENARIDAIQERRIEYVQKTLQQISQKHYEKQYVELTAELGDIASQNFERLYHQFTTAKKGAKKMNAAGREAVKHWAIVTDHFRVYKEEQAQSFINCLYNKARVFTRLHETDPAIAKANIAAAIECYKEVKSTIEGLRQKQGSLTAEMEQQLSLATDFCKMLPVRLENIK